MNKSQLQVKEFHEAFGVPVHDCPQVTIAKERALLRAKLIYEEADETIRALNCIIIGDKIGGHSLSQLKALDEFKLAEIADGLADLIYVINGAALEFGIDLEPVLNEVHRSNLSKQWTTEEVEAGIPDGWSAVEIDGMFPLWCVKDETGKVRKPKSYSPANIAAVLEKQRI